MQTLIIKHRYAAQPGPAVHTWRRLALALALLLAATQLRAQQRRAYPAPHLTPEVKAIRQAMRSFRATTSQPALPTHVDNSRLKYFPPIIDQEGGSCAQASSIGYVFSYEMNRLLERDASASADNRFAYKFSWNMLNDGEDQGGFAEQGLYLAQRYGMMTEADYGATGGTYQFRWATGYDKYERALHYRASEILSFPAKTEADLEQIKRYLYDAGDGSSSGGLLCFSTQSSGWTIDDAYNGPQATGYHSLLTRLAPDGAHAMTIVGYDDLVTYTDPAGQTHTGAFIVANTWGTYQHDHGRFYLPYYFFTTHQHTDQQLASQMQGVRVCTYQPQAVFRVRLSYTSRNDLSFGTAFRTDGLLAQAPQYAYAQAFNNAGGDHPMQGQWLSGDIEIAIDATPSIVPCDPEKEVYSLAVKKAAIGKEVGTGEVTGVWLIDYRGDSPTEYACTQTTFPAVIQPGLTVFSVRPADKGTSLVQTSASPYRYLDGRNATPATYVVRTADGQTVKMRFSNLNGNDIDLRVGE